MGNEPQKKQKPLSASELQTYVMIIQAKLTQGRNKKVLEISKKRKEIIELLKEKGLELAKAKMETILQEEDNITVYDILGTLLEKIKEKCSYLLYYEKCPEDMRATLDTIIYASCRLEIDELHTFRKNRGIRYGEFYIQDASSNKSQLCNINVVEKLRVKVPAEQVVVSRLKQLCKECEIDYVFPQEIQPMTNMIDPFTFGNNYNPNVGYPPNLNFNQPMNFNPGNPMTSGYDNNFPTKSVIDTDNPYQNVAFNPNTNLPPNNNMYMNQQPNYNYTPNSGVGSYNFSTNPQGQNPNYNVPSTNVPGNNNYPGQNYPNLNPYPQQPQGYYGNQPQNINNSQYNLLNQSQGKNTNPNVNVNVSQHQHQSSQQFNQPNNEFDMNFPSPNISKSANDDFPQAPK